MSLLNDRRSCHQLDNSIGSSFEAPLFRFISGISHRQQKHRPHLSFRLRGVGVTETTYRVHTYMSYSNLILYSLDCSRINSQRIMPS